MITTDTGAKKIENSDNWRQIFDAHNDSVDAEDKIVPEMAPIVNGNKSTVGAAIGEYVLVRNSSITGITDGAYTAAKAIPANTTIDSTYLTAVGTGGALNALNSNFAQSAIPLSVISGVSNVTISRNHCCAMGKVIQVSLIVTTTATANGEIISGKTIENSIDQGEAYRIMCDGKKAGGVVIHTKGDNGELDLLFTLPGIHSKGVGYAAWCEVEKMHPEVRVWETFTPYFETRNIHFYVNKCGFHIVEFYNPFHKGPMQPDDELHEDEDGNEGAELGFLFRKEIKK